MDGLRATFLLLVAVLALLGQACSTSDEDAPSVAAEQESSSVPPTPTSESVKDEVPEEPDPLVLYTPTEPPPPLDTTLHSVELSDIIFDTFGSGPVPLTKATPDLIRRLRDGIAPIYEPVYDAVDGGDWLSDDDLVIGYASESGGYAYPIKILNLHEIVHDVIDGVPVLVSYCPLYASAVVYDRTLDDRVLVFGNTSALYESDMVMYDHQTGSYWFQVLGEAIVGPLTAKRLTMLPSQTIRWRDWKRMHPDTRILSIFLDIFPPDQVFGNPYDRDPFRGLGSRLNAGRFGWPVSEERLDGRLPAGDRVFAIQVAESHKGYLLSPEEDWVAIDVVGERAVVVIGRAGGPSASAYFSRVDGRDLTFKLDSQLRDVETGTTWNDGGLAVAGPLSGTQLIAIPSRTSFWFSLVGALPGIELYRPER